MTTHLAQIRTRHSHGTWKDLTRPVTAERAAAFLDLMLMDHGVPREKLERAHAVLVDGAVLQCTHDVAFRVVPIDRREEL